MAYEKTVEAHILRVTHKITFSIGTRAFDLREMLKHVPDEVTIDEILDEENGIGGIVFQEERKENL